MKSTGFSIHINPRGYRVFYTGTLRPKPPLPLSSSSLSGSATMATTVTKRLNRKERDIRMMLGCRRSSGHQKLRLRDGALCLERRSDGIYIINLGKTWEKLQLAARVIVA
ncbi:hypothetical protein Dimus_036815, partial [Dionaea muscipula]